MRESVRVTVTAIGLGLGFSLSLGLALGAQTLPDVTGASAPPLHTPGHALIEGAHETVSPATNNPKFGPAGGTFITTDDPRRRIIHGGGSSLQSHAFDPYQRLTPTYGCTRACNADLVRLGNAIRSFQQRNPAVVIPYLRVWQ